MSRKFSTALIASVVAIFLSTVLFFVNAEEAKKEEPDNSFSDDPNVLVLTDDNFDSTLAKNDVVLNFFGAPWCGHCKALKPKWTEAAAKLAENAETKEYKLAYVDATAQPKVSGRFRIEGYPTIKLFRGGEVAEDYEGGRNVDDIVNYLKKKGAQPVNKELKTPQEFRDATKVAKMTGPRVVGVFASKDSVDYKYFKSVALQFAGTGLDVFHTASQAVLEDIGFFGSGSAIHVYRPFAKPTKVTFKGTVFKQELYDWIFSNALPADAVAEYTEDNAKLFSKTGDTIVRIITDGKNPAVQSTLAAAVKSEELTKKSDLGNIRFATSKWDEFEKDAVKECGEDSKKDKTCVIGTYGSKVKGKAGASHGMDTSPFTSAAFDKFLDRFIKKQLKSKVKSEPLPADEPTAGKVQALVGNNFAEQVLESDKAFLIKAYAPWCGHCKAMAPAYEQLAEQLADKFDQVSIAKFDMTSNDLPAEARSAYPVSGFPTLYFAKKGKDNKLKPVKYEGERNLDAMKKFVLENL